MKRVRSISAVMALLGAATLGMALSSSAQASTAGQRTVQIDSPAIVHIRTHHATEHYSVRPGDTLTSISRKVYGHASRWPALWWTNRHRVHNPDALRVGQRLVINPGWHPRKDWILTRALRHIPAPAPAPVARHAVLAAVPSAPPSAPVSAAAPAQPVASYSGGGGSFRACVLRAESGGNYSAYNPSSGAGGAYQFLQSTWSALGFPGSPQTASPAMQDAAFAKEYAQSGTSAWAPYDGC